MNAVDDFGCTALHDAARAGATDAVALLLRSGASPAIAECELSVRVRSVSEGISVPLAYAAGPDAQPAIRNPVGEYCGR